MSPAHEHQSNLTRGAVDSSTSKCRASEHAPLQHLEFWSPPTINGLHTFFSNTPCIHAHIQASVSYFNVLSSNMHSHKTLALLALAASTASPAFSAPVLEGQQQARASVAAAEEAASGIGGILKTIGTGLGFGALPVVLQNVLGGNSTRRDTPHIIVDGLPVPIGGVIPNDTIIPPSTLPGIANKIPAPVGINRINRRGIGSAFGKLLDGVSTSGSIGKVLSDGLLGGVASGAGAIGAGELFNLTRREPSPLSLPNLSGVGKTILGAGTGLAAADVIQKLFGPDDSTSRRDLNEALQLLSRQLDELD
ncbi:hypothetical protein EDB92DRAFT_1828811 [Lactarius akahatsu]|uniref:Uncharacterized protein n=1 Tax=Lactarius akahatsu TaxID=416441 RepID=A0AAD4LSP9_9AGAM|nr:hypothetical protein EDB92DRAFT_1828811 [Lactarius akahatsu]